MKRIGILTGGGDCPGLNAVIRSAVIRCEQCGMESVGLMYGWRSMIDNRHVPLNRKLVKGIQTEGGTILGSSRTNLMQCEGGLVAAKRTLENLKLDAVIAIGGDDTLGVAMELSNRGLPMIGVPKTIDNDLSCTDYTFGFDTAASIAMEAIERVKTTAASHERTLVVEVMGRYTGWIALEAAVAADAHMVLIPEFPVDINEIVRIVNKRYDVGNTCNVIVVAEGFWPRGIEKSEENLKDDDMFGHTRLARREVSKTLAEEIERRTGHETRHIVLGHVQRGGNPTMFDRFLGTRMGTKAVELVMENQFGSMVALHGTSIESVPLSDALSVRKCVPQNLYEMANMYIGKG